MITMVNISPTDPNLPLDETLQEFYTINISRELNAPTNIMGHWVCSSILVLFGCIQTGRWQHVIYFN